MTTCLCCVACFPHSTPRLSPLTHPALDTNSTLALLNNLCQLTYLTSTSPRIREILTMDGGLERMLDILRDSCLPREPTIPDLWGLNGPCTARPLPVDRTIQLRHSLAFQCVVNIGVRGNEDIRTRVVQAGALDIVAQILESWLKKNGIAVFSSSMGSQVAVDAIAAGVPVPGAGADVSQRRRQGRSHPQQRHSNANHRSAPDGTNSTPQTAPSPHAVTAVTTLRQHAEAHTGAALGSPISPIHTQPVPSLPGGFSRLMANITNRLPGRQPSDTPPTQPSADTASSVDTDVDMADGEAETGGETDTAGEGDTDTNNDADGGSMDLDEDSHPLIATATTVGTTPRARLPVLPLQIPRRSPDEIASDAASASTSNAASLSGDEPQAIPRARSDNSLATNAAAAAADSGRPASGLADRMPQMAQETVSSQSSPMPIVDHVEGHMRGRRGTVVGRPLLLQPREQRMRGAEDSEASDGPHEADLAEATALAAAATAAMEAAAAVPNQPENGPQPAIVDGLAGLESEDPDPEALAAEQARFDMEAGAPPGQPGAAQTPRVTTTDIPGQVAADLATQPAPPTQIIIANHAPRGFQDLGSYVNVSLLLNPDGTNYSEDNILLALQLLAYLSKYAHVRSTFHHPRRPMHRTFDLNDETDVPLPQRPAYSETPNIFSLVERFTFRPSPADPTMFRIPGEIQYWAGVIMRNACRKDDAQGGIRQCAYMSCGRWEKFPREFAKCRRCRKAKYCSKECQSKAWSEGHRFWCSLRSENDQNADAAAAGGDSERRRRDRRNDGARDEDEDVDMGDGATPQAATTRTTRGPTGGGTQTTRAAAPLNVTVPAGATAPQLRTRRDTILATGEPLERTETANARVMNMSNQATPRVSISEDRTPSPRRDDALGTSAPTPPAPRPLPAFLKVRSGTAGPSSTGEMNAAMMRDRQYE